MSDPVRAWLATAALACLCGCATAPPLYHWGHYEQLVYDMYLKPGEADPSTQVDLMIQDIERAQTSDQRVPPGVHAHLGYLYFNLGKLDLSGEEFLIEKELFPESVVFIDGILERMSGQ